MNILETIAVDLNIAKGKLETENCFRDRVVLSALSKWMLTACFNGTEEASVESIKAVVTEKLSFLRDAFSMGSTSLIISEEHGSLAEYMYSILLENGAFYHRAYYVSPREHSKIPFGSSALIQGLRPGEDCSFSGLAPFIAGNGTIAEICEEFDLPSEEMDAIVPMVWRRSVPANNDVVIKEYLKFNQLRKGYYAPNRTDSNPVTMGRSMHTGAGYEHYLIQNGECRRIPDDLVAENWNEYCRLAIINSTSQQSVVAESDASIVHLHFDYILPPKDLRFMRYIAWPVSLSLIDGAFDFSVNRQLWPAVKERLYHLNYKVEEK